MNDITALLPHIKLRFNIEHPTYEDSYAYGYECALADVAEEDNPFQKGTQQAEHWLEGWWDAIEGEAPLFELNPLDKEEVAATAERAANDQEYCQKHSFLSLVIEISGAIAASAIVGYQLFELVA
ncbi:transmission trait enhancer LetE [Fluoribacter dumoffii]|uniref:Transmission trait enhancer protein LetE n=1 Tax=Fluoribacter dumoffii TaxID=463 RepID=A0A377G7H7_9GAMM|nr:transmission trait enhancer protein LetE [Fluoribacter dumoffii]KTC92480.1 transmission trait enhancer protein LetE [Fluoribacter dumoffii NY 23]MCW8387056.1 transmission trait enhancer LetE [Fluoribacter dumoffii]MCW8417440.1 transmission trait enhancer LetE [Fluoribacter dumoffii]MCW8454718.1 transmission trait enhancer LetE [Fluoribacter dumoffii]MCW8461204.1 transmission trait enhancer LetE [Fluoribacter dumoffii]